MAESWILKTKILKIIKITVPIYFFFWKKRLGGKGKYIPGLYKKHSDLLLSHATVHRNAHAPGRFNWGGEDLQYAPSVSVVYVLPRGSYCGFSGRLAVKNYHFCTLCSVRTVRYFVKHEAFSFFCCLDSNRDNVQTFSWYHDIFQNYIYLKYCCCILSKDLIEYPNWALNEVNEFFNEYRVKCPYFILPVTFRP